jgi:hypothetical protein
MPALPSSPPPSSPLAIEPISMRIPDACRFTGISRSSLYLLIARGEVEIVKMGAATLVLTESLRNLIERQRGSRLSRTAFPIRRSPTGHSTLANTHHRSRTSDQARAIAPRSSMPLFEVD